jgi:hypothetical protein
MSRGRISPQDRSTTNRHDGEVLDSPQRVVDTAAVVFRRLRSLCQPNPTTASARMRTQIMVTSCVTASPSNGNRRAAQLTRDPAQLRAGPQPTSTISGGGLRRWWVNQHSPRTVTDASGAGVLNAKSAFHPVMIALLIVAWAGAARAQSIPSVPADAEDHVIVYEVGWAGDWSHAEGLHPNGGTVAFEVTPVEHWLELEIGFTAIRADASTEIPVDILFKKPWQISRTFEFMIGAGPEIVHATGPDSGTFWGLSSVLDFMFWPKRNVGWYLEPGYEVTFRNGASHHGLGINAGLLIGH